MTVAVGVVIVALVECVIASFGLKVFQRYERCAWLPQLIVLLQLYVPNAWAAAASDSYVYHPSNTPRWKAFALTLGGLCLSFWFVNLLGIGLGCQVAALPAWSDAYNISSGALIFAGFALLGGFGKFCSVVVALGVTANCVPGTYSAAIDCQIMGRWGQRLPRWVWVVVLCAVQLVCGVAERNQLFIIFTNVLALMGYWVMPMICIVIEEHLLVRRGVEQDWTAWNDKSNWPIAIAALIAFLLGWIGAILDMYEVWYVGPLANASGGADVGMRFGRLFVLVSFPPLRRLELGKSGR
ncbi:Vitamin B6 transporter [Elasticomyces elasticus]|nr:Vitamin B6 transporter [Elasticomyces elasticus]